MRPARAAVACALAALAGAAGAQTIYRYRDPDGVWVYSDLPPDDARPYETRFLDRAVESPEVRLLRRNDDDGTMLIARNTYYAPVEVTFRLLHLESFDGDVPSSGSTVVPPRSDAELLWLPRADPSVPMSLQYELRYLPGVPDAVHRPPEPYRLPYALASAHVVSQAYPDAISHGDPASRHAVDFVMPVGTGVYAAREGVVIDVASDYYDAGLDPAQDGPRANYVRILHDDGTMSLYAHLNWNSIRVVPGQRVARGEYLADSGNTGFSTGPHLHFVVQRNHGGRLESVPLEFLGAGGEAVAVRRGDRPVAH